MESANSKLFGFVCDVTKKDQTSNIFNDISKKFGNIYGLVNNAGVNPSRNNILNTTFDDWEKTLNVNLTGAYLCSKLVISQMLKKGHGSIVNISSIAGIKGIGSSIAYASSKGALNTMTLSMARNLGPIRVNAICPGFIEGEWLKKGMGHEVYEATKSHIENTAPLKKTCTPESISEVIFNLIDNSSLVTGQIITVDGGVSLNL